MDSPHRKLIVCTCEDTMPLDIAGLERACARISAATTLTGARHLCGPQLDLFRAAAADGRLTVACTQEQPLFAATADEDGLGAELTFVNIRERAGWSSEARDATPKIAALLALATHQPEPTPFVSFESRGVTLVLGCDETALTVADALADTLDLTVLLSGTQDVAPP